MDRAKLVTWFLAFLLWFVLPAKTAALVPYTRSLLDSMFPPEDPFRILEHSPLSFPRGVAEDSSSAALALAPVDWRETPSEHQISLDIPGMKREDIRIEVEDNRVLSISGERKKEVEVKDERWHRAERTVGKFWRQFRLPANADVERVGARLENGVLRITVPKLAEANKKKKEPKVISIVPGDKASGESIVTPGKQEL